MTPGVPIVPTGCRPTNPRVIPAKAGTGRDYG